jgi:rubredoxin
MGHPIPKQHPAVVLRAHYNAVRALLAVALLAVVALAATVVILATDDETASIAPRSAQLQPEQLNYGGFNPATGRPATVQEQTLPPGTRFDGGPDEGTRGIEAQPLAPGTRYDGGPDEGTRGIEAQPLAPGTRFYGGPDEGTRGIEAQPLAPGTRFDGGPDEGTRGPQYQAPDDGFKTRAGGPRMIPQGPAAR